MSPQRALILLLALLSTLVSSAGPAHAGPQFGAQHAHAKLFTRVEDGRLRAAIEIRIDKGWHLYHEELGDPNAIGKPTTVELSGDGIEWSSVRFPEPHKADQVGLDSWIYQHEGTIVLYASGRLAAGAEGADAAASLDGLTCEDAGTCVPYGEDISASGSGPDAVFADFPDDLESGAGSADGPSPVPTPIAAPEEIVAEKLGGEASAKLYVRVDDGGRVRAALEVSVSKGWHIYHDDMGDPEHEVMKTSIELLPSAGVRWSAPRFPKPHAFDSPGVGLLLGHEGKLVVYAAGELEAGAPANFGAWVEGKTCSDQRCVPYEETVVARLEGGDALLAAFPEELFDDVPAAGGSAPRELPPENAHDPRGTHASAGSSVDADDPRWAAYSVPDFQPQTEPVTRGLFTWLLLAFVAGMLLNVMPCVLPVISIKILSFVQQAGEDRQRILALGLAFAAGILVVFLALAVLAVAVGLSWGEQFQSPTFLVAMIGIVFAFALSLFGVFELGVPSAVGGMASGPPREGLPDAFFKGMLATVLATPCSGPFLGSTLTWTLSQPSLVVFSIFACLGLGMALPYVVLTAAPGLLKVLPKPGAWMETFKQAMGFVLLATVVYLMVSLRQDLLLFTIAFLVFVGFGCWWWGRFATFDQSLAKRWATLAVAVGFVALGAYASFDTFRGFFVVEEGEERQVAWEDFEPERFDELLASGRSVFVDFTADWCPNCKFNEKVVYESDEVAALLREKGVVPLIADITNNSPRSDMLKRLRDDLGARSIPFMAVFPGDDPFRPHVRWDIVGKDDMASILRSLPDARVASGR